MTQALALLFSIGAEAEHCAARDGVFFGTDIYDSSNLDDLNREKHDLGNQKGIDYGGRTAATDELNAKAAAAQGGGDNKALAMFGGGKKKSPFG